MTGSILREVEDRLEDLHAAALGGLGASLADAPRRDRRRALGAGALRRATVGNRSAAGTAAVLIAGDVGGFLVAGQALAPLGASAGHAPAILSLAAVAALVLFWCASLYPGYGVHAHELLRRRAVAFCKVGGVAGPCAAILTGGWQPPALVAAFLALAMLIQPALRAAGRAFLRHLGWWGVSADILGGPAETAAVRQFLTANWQLGVRCRAAEVAPYARSRMVLVAGPLPGGVELDRLRRGGAEVIVLADIPGARLSGLRPSEVNGEIGLRLSPSRGLARPGWPGRSLDLAIALLALPVVLPIVALAGLAIYLADPGPVTYRQTREGFGGRPFRLLKLRTMYRDAEQRIETLLATDEAARAEWATYYKLRKDPRILPRIGAFLRATSIDELPQLFNVLTGEMRIVGPRPFPLYHLGAMDEGFRAKRCTVVPGVTGLWQVSGRSTTAIEAQQDLDAFYIDNRSFWLDLHNLACPASPVHYQFDPVQTVKTNVHGAINMLGLAKRTRARIFQASTSEVYGDPSIHPQPESYRGSVNPVGPRACYDEGKRCAETLFFDYHRQFGVDIRVARIFNTYGPRMHPNDGRVVSNFIVQALRGEPVTLYGDGSQTRSFCFVDDLIEGFVRLMEAPGLTGPMNLGNPVEFTVRQLAELVIDLTGSASRIEFRPLPQDDPVQRQPDITRARADLGWQPRIALRDGLAQTIAYFEGRLRGAPRQAAMAVLRPEMAVRPVSREPAALSG